MFPSGTIVDSAIWPTESATDSTASLPGHAATSDIGNRTAPANITNVLTITDVRSSFNGTNYVCGVIVDIEFIGSNASILTVLGKFI